MHKKQGMNFYPLIGCYWHWLNRVKLKKLSKVLVQLHRNYEQSLKKLEEQKK